MDVDKRKFLRARNMRQSEYFKLRTLERKFGSPVLSLNGSNLNSEIALFRG